MYCIRRYADKHKYPCMLCVLSQSCESHQNKDAERIYLGVQFWKMNLNYNHSINPLKRDPRIQIKQQLRKHPKSMTHYGLMRFHFHSTWKNVNGKNLGSDLKSSVLDSSPSIHRHNSLLSIIFIHGYIYLKCYT